MSLRPLAAALLLAPIACALRPYDPQASASGTSETAPLDDHGPNHEHVRLAHHLGLCDQLRTLDERTGEHHVLVRRLRPRARPPRGVLRHLDRRLSRRPEVHARLARR